MPSITNDRTRVNIEIAKALGFEPRIMKRNGKPDSRTWKWPDEWRGRYGSMPYRAVPDFVQIIEDGLTIRDGLRGGFDTVPDFYGKGLVPKDRSTGGGLPHTAFGDSPEQVIIEVFGEEYAVTPNKAA